MNSIQINCFLKAAETHSFTKAAAEMYLTQQSVSSHVALLEKEVGAKLLNRESKYLTLTEAGVRYYDILSAAERKLSILKKEIDENVSRLSLHFKIGISEWLDPFGIIGAAIEAFRMENPATTLDFVQLDNETQIKYLTDDKLDAAFFSEGQYPDIRELNFKAVAEGEICLYAPLDVISDKSPEMIDRCWNLPMLMAPSLEWGFFEQKQVKGREQAEFGLHPETILSLPNLHSMEAAMRFGRAVTVGESRFGIFNGIPGLGRIPLPPEEHLILAWPSGRLHPLLNEFIKTVEEILNKE